MLWAFNGRAAGRQGQRGPCATSRPIPSQCIPPLVSAFRVFVQDSIDLSLDQGLGSSIKALVLEAIYISADNKHKLSSWFLSTTFSSEAAVFRRLQSILRCGERSVHVHELSSPAVIYLYLN